MKKYLKIIIVITIIVICLGGYYLWCSYHPFISVRIGDGGGGPKLKVQIPTVVYAGMYGVEPASSIKENLIDFQDRANAILEDVLDNYQTSDIKLTIKVLDGQTILKYEGTATNLSGEMIDYKKEVICDYVLSDEY